MSDAKRGPAWQPGPFDRKRLTVQTMGVDERAIKKAYADPNSVREATWLRLRVAAEQLGLPLPRERNTSDGRGKR